jgi:kinesin family protein 15
MQRHDSDDLEKIGCCSDEGSVRNSEDMLSPQIELDILKTIFVEEVKAANFHILEACRQKEATEKKLNVSRSKEEYLELLLTDEIKKLKEMEKEKNVLLEKRDMETPRLNSELKIHLSSEYLPYEEPKMQYLKCLHIEDSPLSSKLKRMQASLEKAHNLNTRYEQDLASRRSAEHVKDEVCRDVEIALNQVISSLTEQLSSVELQLDSSKKNELLAKKNLDEIHILLDESIEALVQKEVLEQNYLSVLRGMEEEICQLKSQLNQSDRCYEVRLKELEIKMQHSKVEASTLLAAWNNEREVTVQNAIRLASLEFWSFKEFCFF